MVLPPHSSQTNPFSCNCWRTFRGEAFGMIALIDGNHDGDLGRQRVIQRLDRLRHDAVVRRHHQDHDVRHVRAARPHRAEGLVTRRVQKRDLLQLVLPFGMWNGNGVGRQCAA